MYDVDAILLRYCRACIEQARIKTIKQLELVRYSRWHEGKAGTLYFAALLPDRYYTWIQSQDVGAVTLSRRIERYPYYYWVEPWNLWIASRSKQDLPSASELRAVNFSGLSGVWQAIWLPVRLAPLPGCPGPGLEYKSPDPGAPRTNVNESDQLSDEDHAILKKGGTVSVRPKKVNPEPQTSRLVTPEGIPVGAAMESTILRLGTIEFPHDIVYAIDLIGQINEMVQLDLMNENWFNALIEDVNDNPDLDQRARTIRTRVSYMEARTARYLNLSPADAPFVQLVMQEALGRVTVAAIEKEG